MAGIPVAKGYCGQCERGCWETCEPVNSRGYCGRQLRDARRMWSEYEKWFDSKSKAQLRKYFGHERVDKFSIISDILEEEFGPNILLENIWSW